MSSWQTPLLSLALAASVAQPQNVPFTLGPIQARPGQMVSGIIEVPAAADAGTELPVTVIHGTRPGPVLALVAGVHGYEYPPILALQKLRSDSIRNA